MTRMIIMARVNVNVRIPCANAVSETIRRRNSRRVPVAVSVLQANGSSADHLVVNRLITSTIINNERISRDRSALIIILRRIIMRRSRILNRQELRTEIARQSIRQITIINSVGRLQST